LHDPLRIPGSSEDLKLADPWRHVRRGSKLVASRETREANMAESRGGRHWTGREVSQLRQLARENTPTRVIGLKLGRTPEAVYSKASESNISLKPTNQSPYGRRR